MSQHSTDDNVVMQHEPAKEEVQDNDHVENNAETEDESFSFLSAANLKVASVQIIGATLNGYSIGFVAVYSTLFGFSNNCAMYKSQLGCNTASNQDYHWYTNITNSDGGYCGWPDITCR